MVICSPQLGLSQDSVLGGEVYDHQILLGLSKLGIKVEIILPKNKPHDQNIKNWNFTYLPISHFPAVIGNLLMVPYLFTVYKKRKFEIIRLHQPQFLGLGALFFKVFNNKVKIVSTYHQFKESNFLFLSKQINKLWDYIIVDSENVKTKLIKAYKIPSTKIAVIHNGVPTYLKPTSKNSSLMNRLKLKGKIVILYMGLFDKRKNPLFLLDVLSILQKETHNLTLLFWGKGPLEQKIIKKAKDLGLLGKIKIIKPIFGKEKNKIHNLCDIFVHPSLDEGFALAPLESMSCAKPIVITKGFSAGEAVKDGLNGYLAKSNDVQDWCDKIKKLARSPRLMEKMGKASLEKVKKEFRWDLSVEKHAEVFKRISK